MLLDYENVQPTEGELRTMVPAASELWVFHGPNQRQIEQRFSSFGDDVTAVPISRTGKNALDFHLSFYMGYHCCPVKSRTNSTGYRGRA
ncbi:MAG TPA: PIN domain-containing protein, partial [Rubrivivax sp.]|nr:PIN domain-containing protein [Rubrivivax sp.]